MELSAGPAALGGIMMGVALGAWTLGRWQGGFALPDDGGGHGPTRVGDAAPTPPGALAEAPAKPDQQHAFVARGAAVADPLGELHAEISAYRRAEQVLADVGPDELVLRHRCGNTGPACRHPALTGEPVCDLSGTVRPPCATGASGARAGSACRAQPSPAAFAPLRV